MNISPGTPQRLHHLPLVADVIRRTGVPDIIDQCIVEDRRSKVSTSECLQVILLGVFIGEHGLWRLRERLDPYDMKTIMQDSGFEIAEFPEERLAKALDDLYTYGLDRLMTGIALQAIEQFRLETDFLHFDTTSLSCYGAYEAEYELPSNGITAPPKVTYGHAKNKRSDLKQIMYGALVTRDGGVPLWGKALDGNLSDNISTAEFFGIVRNIVKDPSEVCCVADSKGWCARVLEVARGENLRVLSRLPRTHTLSRTILARTRHGHQRVWAKDYSADTPEDERDFYEYQGWDEEETYRWESPGNDGKMRLTQHAIPVRAVRIFSSALLRAKRTTLERTRKKEQENGEKLIRRLQKKAYKCRQDAERDCQRECEGFEKSTCRLVGEVQEREGPYRRGRGRPPKNPEPELTEQHFWIRYSLAPTTKEHQERILRRQATFILIRTRNAGWEISDEEMIHRYKGQYHCEHGFSWLKSRAAINPLFVEKPQRMASLSFIYTIGLMTWNLIQRTVRKNLKAQGKGLPYHRNKPSDNITTRFFFELYRKVQSIPIATGDQIETHLLGMDEWTELGCRMLGTRLSCFKST
jgi:transposase